MQLNSNTTRTTTNSISVSFSAAQTVGNLNVVVVGWADATSTIQSVTDTNKNVYVLAAGTNASTSGAPAVSQAIYYAANIKAGSNTVTVTFSQNPKDEDVRILEYNGLDTTAPLDTTAGSMIGNTTNCGTATAADSCTVTTNSANDLLIGAGSSTDQFTAGDSNYTEQTFSSGYGDVVEDRTVTATGSFNATATVSTGKWVMQIVVFRKAGQVLPPPSAPTAGSPALPAGNTAANTGGDPLPIAGNNLLPGATVVFSNGTTTASAVNCVVASSTSINCITPVFPTGSADITVTNIDGQSFLTGQFTFVAANPPQISGISKSSGFTNGGTSITITGSFFQAGATVTVGGVLADLVSVQDANDITCNVPAHSAGVVDVVVKNPDGRTATDSAAFTYTAGGGVSFVQVNDVVGGSGSATVGAPYSLAQEAGDTNIVVVSWADNTAQVLKVTDSAGNTYVPALNPIVISNLSQAIYYAKNIKTAGANSNTVTVTFTANATTPDLRVLEYAGIDTVNAVDTAKSASSPVVSTTADSGTFTTTFAADLVIAAVAPSTTVAGGGPGFTTVNLPTSGDYVEHKITSAAGSVDAQATLKTSGAWVIQAVAFRESATASQPNFAVSASPGTISVTRGSSASYTITVTPQNGFSSAVNLSASCPPNVQITCTINPGSVTPGSTSVTATLTVATTGASAALFAPQRRQLLPLYALFLPLPGVAFIGAGWAGSRKRKLGVGGGIVLTFLLLLLLLGCGGGGSTSGGGGGGGNGGTPAGTYNITITATSGSVSHTATAAVTVQ
ncbi:MAG TPA: IPT/TIG domain-containing protein [Terriglobales bacterium]|nr:IPT/TIG domain-containing protein [Terriglobales bacterium]